MITVRAFDTKMGKKKWSKGLLYLLGGVFIEAENGASYWVAAGDAKDLAETQKFVPFVD